MEDLKNFKIDEENKLITVSIKPKIFPLEVIYSAAYVFMDKAYVIIDGNPKKEILVQLKMKEKKQDLEKVALEFNNELLNYAVYAVQAAKTQEIRKAIVQRALMTNTLPDEYEEPDEVRETLEEEYSGEEIEFIEDPLGIAKQWTPESAEGLKPPQEIEDSEDITKRQTPKK